MDADSAILSPHVAGWTRESHIKLATTIVEKVKKLFF
jgi:D-3-phosphoglycerate dehydrogenase